MQAASKKTYNNDLVDLQLRDRPPVVLGMPNTLIIEPGAICSLECPFCPQSADIFELTRELLKLSDFKKIIDYFEEFVDTVNLFNWGEPLLNPYLPEMIAYATGRKIRTIIHSNLNFLNEHLAEKLVRSGLSELVASIDGASEESYQAYRKGGSLKVALENLALLLNQKKKLESGTPNIIWKFLVFKQNENEIEQAKDIAKKIGVTINFSFAVAPGEFEPTLQEYNNKDFLNKFIKNYGLPCDQLWKAPVICPDGSILPCCMVSQKKYILGNLFKQDFWGIWNGEQYQLLRKIARREVSKTNDSVFCNYCIFGPNIKNGLS